MPLALAEEAPALPWFDEPPELAPPVSSARASVEPIPAPEPASAPQPTGRRGWLRSGASGVALGLMAGVALGSGVVWLARPAPFAPSAAPEGATTPDASREEAGVAVASPAPSVLDVAPSLALVAARATSGIPPLQVPVDQPPDQDIPARAAEAGAVEDGTVDVTSAAPVDAALEVPSFLVVPDPEAGIQATTVGLPAMVRPGPFPALAAPPSSDVLPLAQDVPPRPNSGLPNLDWQVALHLPPGTSPEALWEARSALRAAGVGLVADTSVSRFGVAQSEVRFFHGDDAPGAARIAAAMGAQARDFSAYRPIPPPGTFEVWLVESTSDVRTTN